MSLLLTGFSLKDADKGGYVHYYQMIMSRGLLAENGIIVVDNTFFMGGAANPILNRVGPFKEINEFNKVRKARTLWLRTFD